MCARLHRRHLLVFAAAFTPQDLPIPQLSVMGDQSSGKSSVLEFLSGVPFPRGTGLVTRCATQYVGRLARYAGLSCSVSCVCCACLPRRAVGGLVALEDAFSQRRRRFL